MIVFIYILTIGAAALILWGILGSAGLSSRSQIELPQAIKQTAGSKRQALLSSMLPYTQGILEKTGLYDKIRRKLEAAHTKLTPPAFFNLKILLMATLAVLAFFILGKFDPLVSIVCIFLGYIAPDILLNRKIGQRREAIVKQLPETVDLLDLCVEAGLDFATAVKWVIDKVPSNPLVEELAFVLEEIQWGKGRTQALKDMSKRLNIPEISSFVQTLVLAERMGTPVAEAFVILSEDARLQRFHRGERFAMRAPIKILLPLIFCILPVIAIVIGGPIFLEFMNNKLF